MPSPREPRLFSLGIAVFGAMLGVIALVAVVVYAIDRQPTTFNITASTERIEMRTGEHRPPSRWTLYDVELRGSHDSAGTRFTGALELSDSVKVMIQRVAFGSLWVNVQSDRPGRSVGRYFTTAGVSRDSAPDEIDIYVDGLRERADSGKTVILSLFGEVWLGRSVTVIAPGSSAVLRAGKVTLIGKSIFSSDVFEGGSVELDAGDQVDVPEDAGVARGFMVADERPALTAAYQVVSEQMVITRPGGGTFPLTASFVDSVTHDRVSQLISVVSAILVVLAAIGSVIFDALQYRRDVAARRAVRRLGKATR